LSPVAILRENRRRRLALGPSNYFSPTFIPTRRWHQRLV